MTFPNTTFTSHVTVVEATWLQAVNDAVNTLVSPTSGAALVNTSTGESVEAVLSALDTSSAATYMRRRVPASFVRGDGNTRVDIFPLAVNYAGPGGVVLNKSPLDVALTLGNVVAHETEADVWVSPLGAGTFAGTSRANAMSWAAAWRTLTTGRKLMLIDSSGPYPPLSLLSGTDVGAGHPKWLQSIDGRVRFQADTALGQPVTQTWTLHSGVVYKTVLTSVDYDQPQAFLKTLVPNVRDGMPDSMLKYTSVAALTSLGSGGDGWFFDSATDTLYVTYFGNDLTVANNRNFQIIYSSKTLDSVGEFSAEWLLGGCTVILEGNFDLAGVWINCKEVNNALPIFMSEGALVQLCATQYGLRAEGLVFTKGRSCYRSKHDGLNAYKSSMNSIVGMTIEQDLVVLGTGDIGTFGTAGPHNNQGFSAHGKSNAMIFGAIFEGNDGQGWADISEAGHYSASWGVGVIVRDNYIDAGISSGMYFDGSSGGGTGGRSAWLDSCVSENDTRSLVSVASAVKVFNCVTPVTLAVSGGTITSYSPATP